MGCFYIKVTMILIKFTYFPWVKGSNVKQCLKGPHTFELIKLNLKLISVLIPILVTLESNLNLLSYLLDYNN